ncbi:MAG: hypothetical protein GQ574_06905 [Crocinitomix sp.]|nr:hypothetical protein [Crocinitomix sp.]
MKEKWVAYNPEWIVKIATEQIPDKPEIIKALSECTVGLRESRAYIYFVNGEKPNQPNSEWQFEENIILEDKKNGTIILDVLKGNKIGGIEFLKFVK